MVLLVLAFLSQVASTQTEFANAVAALSAGDLAKAETGFKSVLKAEPNNLGALANLGVVYSRMDQPAEAIEVYKRALNLSPSEPRLLLNLGLAHMKLDDYAAARPLFERALKKSPADAQLRELLGTTQVYTGQAKDALTTIESLPGTRGVLYLRMLAQLKLEQKDEAEATSAELFGKLKPAEAHFLAGKAYYESALLESAVASFEHAARADENLTGVQRELGKAYVSVRNTAEARNRLRIALKQNPYDQEAAYFLGAILVQEDAADEGIRYLQQSGKTRPNFWGTHYYLGRALLQKGDAAGAVQSLRRAASLNPDEPAVHYQLSRALKAAGRDEESRHAAARVRELQAKTAGKEREALVLR